MSNAVDKGRAYPTHLYEHDIPTEAKKVLNVGDFNIGEYDYISLTYVASGDGAGEIETVVYKTGGVSGTELATLTLAYNASNAITSITKT